MNWKIILPATLAVLAIYALGCASSPPAKTAKEYPSGRVPASHLKVAEVPKPLPEQREETLGVFLKYETPTAQVRYVVEEEVTDGVLRKYVRAYFCKNDSTKPAEVLTESWASRYDPWKFHQDAWGELCRREPGIDNIRSWRGVVDNSWMEPEKLRALKKAGSWKWNLVPVDVQRVFGDDPYNRIPKL